MRTLRAFFWGSVAGVILGYLFAPRGSDLLRAELAEKESERQSRDITSAARAGAGAAGTPSAASTTWRASARYIGNAHTKVYHASTEPNLPEEENRVYFDSAADAEALGYRPAGRLSNAG